MLYKPKQSEAVYDRDDVPTPSSAASMHAGTSSDTVWAEAQWSLPSCIKMVRAYYVIKKRGTCVLCHQLCSNRQWKKNTFEWDVKPSDEAHVIIEDLMALFLKSKGVNTAIRLSSYLWHSGSLKISHSVQPVRNTCFLLHFFKETVAFNYPISWPWLLHFIMQDGAFPDSATLTHID